MTVNMTKIATAPATANTIVRSPVKRATSPDAFDGSEVTLTGFATPAEEGEAEKAERE
jgi:hypothetical protein